MTRLAAAIVRLWVRLYTVGLEAALRERIRQEVEADLWEQIDGNGAGRPMKEAVAIFLRWVLGIPADIQRMSEEPVSPTTQVLARAMRWAAQTIAVCETVFFFLLGLAAFGLGASADGIFGYATALIAVASCIMSRRLERVAGVLLALTFFGVVTGAIFMYGFTHAFWPWSRLGSPLPLFSSPLLLASALFLLSGWFYRKPTRPELLRSPNQ